MARKALSHQEQIIADTQGWAKKHIGKMTGARCVVVFGSGPLYGVAEEGALKVQEVTEATLGIGFETQQRVYGQSACYDNKDYVIVLDDGVNETVMAKNIARYYDQKFDNCLLVGPEPVCDNDLKLVTVGEEFRTLEFITVLQVLAYELAVAQGREIVDVEHYDANFFEEFVKTLQ